VVQTSETALVGELRRCGTEAGLAAVGVAPATPMEATRRILEERKAAGLSANMQFTYRNPARSTDPRRLLPGAAALVVGAWPYGGHAAVRSPPDGRPKGVVARYASRDHYADLEGALRKLADVVKRAGWAARVVFDDNALVDRAAAERAGIGWFGKNSNVLLPGLGSWFLLGSVVTDAPLPVGTPVEEGCGSCNRCLGSCPTGALVAPGVLDARRCLAWLLQAPGVFPFEYRAALGGRIYGCDDCQDVCPANRLAARLSASDGNSEQSPKTGEAEVDLLEMLASSSPALLARHGRWYIPERDPRYLRRNALIALGNVADGQSPEVQATLERYLDGPDDLLRAHAIWAAIAAGRRDLVTSRPTLGEDPSPLVRYELDRS
jgi:epoxyqueuosine reductase